MESHFIHRLLDGHMADVIRSRGYVVHELPRPLRSAVIADGDYHGWAGVSEEDDADATLSFLPSLGAVQLVVDHYGLGKAWEARVRSAVERVVVIDDLANREHDCDVLLDQNYFEDAAARYAGLIPAHCQRLCGPQFALLAPEYAAARAFVRPRRGPVTRVLIFYGGSDPADLTLHSLSLLSEPEFSHLAVDVVVGRNYTNCDELRILASARGQTTIHRGLPSLLPLMIQANLAIGAGGITTWERCCAGLPALVTAIAANQIGPSEALHSVGGCALVGTVPEFGKSALHLSGALSAALRSLINNPSRLADIAEIGWNLGGGQGASTVAELLLPSELQTLRLRAARPNDCRQYWRWANDPAVRAASLNEHFIDWHAHQDWFTRRLNSPDSVLWVLETPRGVPLGQFRVDVADARGRINYSVDGIFRGRGLGATLLRDGGVRWLQSYPGIPLFAHVRSENVASARAFHSSRLFEQITTSSGILADGYDFSLRDHHAPQPDEAAPC